MFSEASEPEELDCTWAGCMEPAGEDGYCARHYKLAFNTQVGPHAACPVHATATNFPPGTPSVCSCQCLHEWGKKNLAGMCLRCGQNDGGDFRPCCAFYIARGEHAPGCIKGGGA